MSQRLFVAALPDEATVDHLADFLSLIGPPAGRARQTALPGWHVTSLFLGDVTADQAGEFIGELREQLLGFAPFQLTLRGGGAFGPPDAPRVWWVGVEDPAGALPELHDICLRSATRAAISVPREPYFAHLTVFRGRPHPTAHWVASWDHYRGPSWTVDSVHLMESILLNTGAHYRSSASFNLRAYPDGSS